MKTIAIFALFFSLACSPLSAQQDFAKADDFAVGFDQPYTDAADLARKLTAGFSTDAEKTRVIFRWIAETVRYDCKKFHNPERVEFSWRNEEEKQRKIREARQKQVASTLKSKKGVCADYAALFQAMCSAAGLTCETVTGDARDFHKPYKNTQNNSHAWNAVQIEGQWHLFDATWASGYVDGEVTKFTRKWMPGYFMTPPHWMVQSHLPEEERWQLLDAPVSKKAFPDQPLVNFGQETYPIMDFSPQAEPVEGKISQVQIRLKFSETPEMLQVTSGRSRPLTFEQKEENGYTVLRFAKPAAREIVVYGGDAGSGERQRMGWLARYEVK